MLRILITPLVSSNSSYKKQELLTPLLISTRFFGGVRVAHLFSFLCGPIMCLYVLSSVSWCPLRFPHKGNIRLVFTSKLFVEGLMSYLRYLCLPTHSNIQHILCCVCALFVYILYTLCCQFSGLSRHFWLLLRYFLMFIWSIRQWDFVFINAVVIRIFPHFKLMTSRR